MQGALYQRKIVIKVASSRLIALAVSDVNPDLALQYASQVNMVVVVVLELHLQTHRLPRVVRAVRERQFSRQ